MGQFCCGHGGLVKQKQKTPIKLKEQYNKHNTTNKRVLL